METFDITVTITVQAEDEKHAEKLVSVSLHRDFMNWEFTEFVPNEDLRSSCCC